MVQLVLLLHHLVQKCAHATGQANVHMATSNVLAFDLANAAGSNRSNRPDPPGRLDRRSGRSLHAHLRRPAWPSGRCAAPSPAFGAPPRLNQSPSESAQLGMQDPQLTSGEGRERRTGFPPFCASFDLSSTIDSNQPRLHVVLALGIRRVEAPQPEVARLAVLNHWRRPVTGTGDEPERPRFSVMCIHKNEGKARDTKYENWTEEERRSTNTFSSCWRITTPGQVPSIS